MSWELYAPGDYASVVYWESPSSKGVCLSAKQDDDVFAIGRCCERKYPALQRANHTKHRENTECFETTDKDVSQGEIDNANKFLLCFKKMNNEIEHGSDNIHYTYLEQLRECYRRCNKMLDAIKICSEGFQMLNSEYEFISDKTTLLNEVNNKLTKEQKLLEVNYSELRSRLHYFTQLDGLLESIHQLPDALKNNSFEIFCIRINECLDFLQKNEKAKDAPVFVLRYQQLLSKMIVAIRNYSFNIIRSATEQIHSYHPTSKLDEDATFGLYYGKYQLSAGKFRKLSAIIEEHTNRSPEYKKLLSEMIDFYFSEREKVMLPAVYKSINELKVRNKSDYCALTRGACVFLINVCQDEHRLFNQFFSVVTNDINSYLTRLCTVLYDVLRPCIIHINHLETLAEICGIFRVEMLEEAIPYNAEYLSAFGEITTRILQDVQERLAFRTHLYLRSDILNYNPSIGDLAYPEKLQMMENIASSLKERLPATDSKSVASSTTFNDSPADMHGMWYPTVRRTLVCLSRLYRCVDRTVFQGLSQEACIYCIQSIAKAGSCISNNRDSIHGRLFQIKHLLILREQIAPFRMDFTLKETTLDFSKLKTAAAGLLQKRKQLLLIGPDNALLEFLIDGTPKVKENISNSREEIDKRLKVICEEFIIDVVNSLVGPITEFVDKVSSFLNASTDAKENTTTLKSLDWANPKNVCSIIRESQRKIKKELPSLQSTMKLYINNNDAEFVIFRLMRNNIINTYIKLEQMLSANLYTPEDMVIIDLPSIEQLSILISNTNLIVETK